MCQGHITRVLQIFYLGADPIVAVITPHIGFVSLMANSLANTHFVDFSTITSKMGGFLQVDDHQDRRRVLHA